MRLISTTFTRLGAALVLLVVLVAVPLAAVALVGLDVGAIADAAATGRLGTDAVVQLGLAVFLLLWVWFVVTALSEVWRVLRWRRSPRHLVLRATMPSPTGWVRGLVRVALISSSVVVAPLPGGQAPHIRPTTVLADDVVAPALDAADTPSTLRSNGRETPYSVAVRLGDPSLRDTIIDLNRGRPTPDGGAWTSGVFPDGMAVAVPEGALAPRPRTTWVTHAVSEGESVYRIAATLAGGDSRRVRDLADQIIDRNLGRTMVDGRLFDDPSLIRPGWMLDVPVEGLVPAVDATVEATGPQRTHVVAAGESYWSIADSLSPTDGPADVLRSTAALIADNAPRLGHDDERMIHPGDVVVLPQPTVPQVVVPPTVPQVVVPPTTVPSTVPASTVPEPTLPPTTPPTTVPAVPTTMATQDAAIADPVRSAPIGRTLGGALLVCAGALGLVEVRRRHRLRRAPSGSYVPAPTVPHVVTERMLRSLGASERAVRLDLALRAAGHALGGSGGFVRAAIMSDVGDVTVVLDRPGHQPTGVWTADTRADRWHLHARVTIDELVATARLAGQPCPAVVHVGALVADGGHEACGDVFIDLEAFGVLSIDGPQTDTDAVLRAIAASLAMSPVGEDLHVVTHRVDLPAFDEARLVSSDDLDRALDLAASFIGSTPTVVGSRRTFELRSRGVGGESWEPVVVLSGERGHDPAIDDELRALAGGGRGLAVVVGRPLGDTATSAALVASPAGWTLRPLDLVVVPAGLDAVELAAVVDLVADADRPLPVAAPVDIGRGATFVEPEWAVMVRVLGGVRVVDRAGASIRFERGRALELMAWLATHRTRPTRSAARAAMWQLDVRDATFANVVSDARRGIARAVPPPDGTEWIARTLTDDLPLHDLVVTDADVLRARLDAARGLPAHEAVAVLEPGVELIEGLPFAGGDHLWPDAEGITSSLIVLATGAAAELARLHLELGDIDGVFRATGRGLAVLGGHEELIGLRMRAHAMRGNLAGVRHEWAFYERALDADPWSTNDPSPTLLSLRRELLSS